jgi:RHS repeat-associated protein
VKSGATTSNGRMTRYQDTTTSTDASYAYDASGQRTKSTVAVSGTTTTTNFTYDGLDLLSLSATQGSATWRIDYLYDEEGVLYGGVYRSPATSSSPTSFNVITNDHGDVLELLDANGAAFASYRYDPWGLPQASGTTTQTTSLITTSTLAGQIASRQVLRFASYAYDAESGLCYCSARYYDPATRQFISKDPARADGEASAFQYCGGDPIGKVDSSGMYAHVFVPTARADQTAYFLKVMQVDAGRVIQQLRSMWWHPWDFAHWFTTSVSSGGAWDLKLCMGADLRQQTDDVFKFGGRKISLDDFGNMHFGYVAATFINLPVTVGGAVIVSVLHHKGYGKTFTDAGFVAWGWRLYHVHGACRRPDCQINRFVYPGHRTVIGY